MSPRLGRAVILVCLVVLLEGCAANRPVRATAPDAVPAVEAARELGARAAALAERLVGVPYRYGGDSPQGFDCSGLVWYVYRELGVAVPRTAAEQRGAVQAVDAALLRPGDLVFFYTPAPTMTRRTLACSLKS